MPRWIRVATSTGHERHEKSKLGIWKCCHRGACCEACSSVCRSGCCATVFCSKGIDVAMIVHGDDFFAEGRAEALLQVDEKPEEQVPNRSCESGGTRS